MTFWGWLLILFIGLKLTGFIDWSWFLVLGPITIPLTIVAIITLGKICVSILQR